MKSHLCKIIFGLIKSFRLFVLPFLLTAFCPIFIFAEHLPVKIYTSADGLGSSFVDCVFRDSRSFMWFCTRDGLSRFDGSRFVNFQIGDADAPPGIEAVQETDDGNYWISTTAGVYRFDPNKISKPNENKTRLDAEFISSAGGRLYKDRKGTLWLISGSFYRLKTDGEKPDFEKIQLKIPPVGNKPFAVVDMSETNDGSVWILSSWGLVRRLPDERLVVYPFEMPFSLGNASMIADKNGRIWLSTNGQIFIVKPEPLELLTDAGEVTVKSAAPTLRILLEAEKNVPKPEKSGEIFQYNNAEYIDKSPIFRLFETSDGTVWITAKSNLLEFSGGNLRVHTRDKGLPNAMERMGEDASGNLWIAGFAGLTRLDRSGLVSFGQTDGTSSETFAAIIENSQGKMFFAAGEFYLNAFDGQKFQAVRPAIEKDSFALWTSRYAFLSSDGDWWILTNEKLYRFSGVKDFAELNGKNPTKIYTTDDGLKSDGIFQIFEDSRGTIWVSTRGNSGAIKGLSRLKKGEEKFYTFSETENFPSGKSPSSFAEDRQGNIWFGHYQGGISRFDGERFENFDEKNGLPAKGIISDLHIDRLGHLWASSSNKGLLRLDDISAKSPLFISLTASEGLSSNNVRTITEDIFGRIYVGTARGIDRISPDLQRIKHFSVNDGLAADFVVDSHRDQQGNLWFATNNGVSRFVPLPDEKTLAPRIFIGGLRIAGVEQTVSDLGNTEIEKGELDHNENNFQIEFFGLDFRAGETLRYQYKLEGADADWSSPGEQRSVTFANLSPAAYRFLVRAVNSEGVASENPAVVSFKILPPIWARWWFIALCVLAVSLIIVSIYRYRIANLRAINAALTEAKSAEENLRKSKEERLAELEQVRTRIATDLHDDIGASLTQIAILSEVARQQKITAKDNGNESEPLSLIYNVSNELVSTMSDIVWAINPTKDHLHDLTLRMRRFASDVLSPKEIDFEFEEPENLGNLSLNSNLRREVFLIFKESINNIVKHSEATEVEIVFKIEAENLFLKIKDNGKGFDIGKFTADSSANLYADYKGGNGISSIKRRAAESGGECEFFSEKGKGTTINLRLPVAIQLGGETTAEKV